MYCKLKRKKEVLLINCIRDPDCCCDGRAADNVTDLAQIFDHFSAVLNSSAFIPSTPPVPQNIIDTVRFAGPRPTPGPC